jgi:hypothetical protein
VDAFRSITTVILNKLTSTKKECEVLIVVEAPYSMRTCWLQDIDQLNFPHKGEVALEYFVNQSFKVIRLENSELYHAQEEDNEIKFMTRSVINSLIRPERINQISLKLRYSFFNGYDLSEHGVRVLYNTIEPCFKGLVTEPHWLMNGRYLIDPLI